MKVQKRPMKVPKRSLDDIAEKIHQARRANIFEVGEWLLEARDLCEPGRWGEWLADEFELSQDTADRDMKATELTKEFRKLRNLKLAKSTLYELVAEDKADLPAIIAELAKHATRRWLRPAQAFDIIAIGRARGRHGDYPPTTLKEIDSLEGSGATWAAQAIEALKTKKPKTDTAVKEIVEAVRDHMLRHAFAEDSPSTDHEDGNDHDKQHGSDDHREAEKILSGSPPTLPPPPQPTTTPRDEHQIAAFRRSIENFKPLLTKPAERFAGVVPYVDLRATADFLNAVGGRSNEHSLETKVFALESKVHELKDERDKLEEHITKLEARIARTPDFHISRWRSPLVTPIISGS